MSMGRSSFAKTTTSGGKRKRKMAKRVGCQKKGTKSGSPYSSASKKK